MQLKKIQQWEERYNVYAKREYSMKRASGFSLVEIIIAIMIVGIMVAGYLGMTSWIESAQRTRTEGSLATLRITIERFQTDTGKLPTTLYDLVQRPSDALVAKKWRGPYIDEKDIQGDAWHQPYVYQPTPGAQHPYILYSWGGKAGEATPQDKHIDVWNI
jgi:general secretion pathway protein G